MFIFSPGAERRSASSTLAGSSILNNALRSNQNNCEFPPIADHQEKKYFILIQGYGRRWYIFFSKNFCIIICKNYKFNTYRNNRRVSSIVTRMVHYPAANIWKKVRKRITEIIMLYPQFVMRFCIKHDPLQRLTKTKSWKFLKKANEFIHRCFANL